ncbi:putative Repressor protein CI [uncultured Alphaproteobacteria bacterium]|uniref:Putative Repressor protein CI n=1 Tax=uncultured Alphaproteobacteria bacterium TaxID=91750 RepID=A0A212KKI8_9PROT|nr:putative Repressor protein CI [uncultured Alphaproteobacteria bacterium]
MSIEGDPAAVPEFRNRLSLLIGEEDPFGWAKRVGIPSSTFDRIWNAGTTPKAPHLVRISEAAGVSIDWLLTGRPAAAHWGMPEGSPHDFVPIPWLQVPGSDTIARGLAVGRLALDRNWLRRAGCPHAETVAMATAVGDSMEPTIRDGDLLLVDTGVTDFRDDAIYLLALGATFRIKRVQRLLNGSVVVKSDNPAYATETLSPEDAAATRCLGRVRWMGRVC